MPHKQTRILLQLMTATALWGTCHRNAFCQATASPMSLASALSMATASNPALVNANQQFRQAQAKVDQAVAQKKLQITFNSTGSVSNGHVIQGPPTEETFGTLQNTVTIPLPIGSKPRLAVLQAEALRDAAQSQVESARLTLLGQVAAAYYDLLRKQALLQGTQDTLDQAERQLSEAQRRNKLGDVPQLDVLRAQVPVASAKSALVGAQNDVVVARQTLNGLLGNAYDTPLALVETVPASMTLPQSLDEARKTALAHSADVKAAESSVRAAEAGLQTARLSREPDFSLQASDTRSNDQTAFSRLDSVQASVTFPLTDGGLARAQVQESQAAIAQAQAQLETARRTVTLTVSNAFVTYQSKQQQVTTAQDTLEIAQITYDKTLLGYKNGLFPLSDVLNAQSSLAQARVAATQAIYDAATANAELATALGSAPQ